MPQQKPPESITQLQLELDQWRSANPPRTRLPESVWESAVDLGRRYGVWQTAKALRLDYMGLKRRLAGSLRPPPRKTTATTAFMELIPSPPPPPAQIAECQIEFESLRGGKMRIQWKSSTEPDWTRLLRAWREAEGA